MGAKLEGLVQADPELMIYALEHLGENVPAHPSNTFYNDLLRVTIAHIRAKLLPIMMARDPNRRLTPEQIARIEKHWGQQAEATASLIQIADSALREDVSSLRKRLLDGSPAARKLTIHRIAQRRLPLEGELIDQLRDAEVAFQAHEALVRLARGTDFGPTPKMSKKDQLRCIAKWRNWLALQQSARNDAVAQQEAPKADVLPAAADAKPSADLLASRLWTELVQSRGREQESALRQLQEGEDSFYTDALALALPELTGAIRDKARDVLVERLTHLTPRELRPMLRDDLAEMRRAAARACALKKERDLVPELIRLLRDKDAEVTQAAHAALKELSGRDFGPATDAAPAERRKAEADWLAWWSTRQTAAK